MAAPVPCDPYRPCQDHLTLAEPDYSASLKEYLAEYARNALHARHRSADQARQRAADQTHAHARAAHESSSQGGTYAHPPTHAHVAVPKKSQVAARGRAHGGTDRPHARGPEQDPGCGGARASHTSRRSHAHSIDQSHALTADQALAHLVEHGRVLGPESQPRVYLPEAAGRGRAAEASLACEHGPGQAVGHGYNEQEQVLVAGQGLAYPGEQQGLAHHTTTDLAALYHYEDPLAHHLECRGRSVIRGREEVSGPARAEHIIRRFHESGETCEEEVEPSTVGLSYQQRADVCTTRGHAAAVATSSGGLSEEHEVSRRRRGGLLLAEGLVREWVRAVGVVAASGTLVTLVVLGFGVSPHVPGGGE
ncbi:hypothetical protein E2C01_056700 [Portunus trituberculatus]|uniref:Uncharacterized protein n=1 Tax=Portunus trituberculatus TaxID=210409 RepID=A0A5B7GUV3_PORTR|nr:hypothetical protein [Portunus trituberculatus]